MDTSAKSDGSSGKRQFRSVQEKLRIVEEANRPGASVAAVARARVNANLVFGWRRLHRRGLLEAQRDGAAVAAGEGHDADVHAERARAATAAGEARAHEARRPFPRAWRSCLPARCGFGCTATFGPQRSPTFSSGCLVDDRAAGRRAGVAGRGRHRHA